MQAIILAAGMGKRLKELTRDNTKCMVKVNGVTLIERMLKQLDKLNLSKVVMVEAIPLSNESIMLVITKIEDPEELDTRFSKFSPYTDETPDFLSDLAGGTLEGADELLKLFSGFKIPEGDEEASLENQTEADDDGYEESAQKTASRVFLFTSLDQVSEAARACDGLYDGINTLYKRPETSQYYLVIRSDGSDLRSFSRVCNILSEYGTKTRSEYASEAFYAEHYEIITRDRALQVLKNI